MFNPHTKFEMSTMTCNEKVEGNAKCKNSHSEPPFGRLRGNARVHLWLDGKRVVDFLLAIIAILASFRGSGTIKQNLSKSAFSEGMGQFERKFLIDGDVARNPFMDC